MKLIKADMKELGYVKRPYSDNYKLLLEFVDSDEKIMEVEEYTHKDSASCCTSLAGTRRRYKELFGNIRIMHRKERVFLVKESVVK